MLYKRRAYFFSKKISPLNKYSFKHNLNMDNKEIKLALLGGEKTISRQFKKYNSIGEEESKAVQQVVESGVLSKFLGCWGEDFYGGPKVKEFEKNCRDFFKVRHAITVNSWTSGLVTAVGALNIEPGDEVIVPTWTMCATATAILHWNGIPVFADIDPKTYCISPESIEKNISPFTKAIISVDIFGHPANTKEINSIAKKYNLKVISDTAQSPGAINNSKFAGTLTDIGGYSLNYHKHIHTGEGGILVTNDDVLAERMYLIRNHAEACVKDANIENINNMIGHNFRLGEMECAIGIEQLKKLNFLLETKRTAANKLSKYLSKLKGLTTPFIMDGCTHAYYVYPMTLNIEILGLSRERIYDALIAEGIQGLMKRYVNLHLLPLYQKKIAYGSKGFPWNSEICKRSISYKKGICPIAEELQDKTFIGLNMCLYELSDLDIDQIIESFYKVWDNLDKLK